jgi:hypothetical protein
LNKIIKEEATLMPKKIDVVYTWVDHENEAWQKEKDQYIKKKSAANNTARFDSSLNELKYSLRSLNLYFSLYIHKIYLVTNHGSIPDFIDQSRADLVIINANGLLKGISFCSCTFESVLHEIPGLTEDFLYFNDDMLLTAPLSLKNLFDATGKPIWYQESDKLLRFISSNSYLINPFNLDGQVSKARENTFQQLGLTKKMPPPIGHSPRILNKTYVKRFISLHPEAIGMLRNTLFRSEDTFCFLDAYCYYFSQHKMLNFVKEKKTLILIQSDYFSRIINKLRIFLAVDFSFICVADLRNKNKQPCPEVSKYLEKTFPKPSQWESTNGKK